MLTHQSRKPPGRRAGPCGDRRPCTCTLLRVAAYTGRIERPCGCATSADVAARTLEVLTDPGPPGSADLGIDYGLTEREHEVLGLLARGLTNQQIADRLVISPITARNHVSNILTKLQLRSRRDVIRRFGRHERS